jgi:hypothetical protein
MPAVTLIFMNPDNSLSTIETDEDHIDMRVTGLIYRAEETNGDNTFYFQPWSRIARMVSVNTYPGYH